MLASIGLDGSSIFSKVFYPPALAGDFPEIALNLSPGPGRQHSDLSSQLIIRGL